MPAHDCAVREPRPSGVAALGGLLTGSGIDGARGLAILAETKGRVFAQRLADFAPRDRYIAARTQGFDVVELREEASPAWILEQTNAVVQGGRNASNGEKFTTRI